MVLPTSKNVYKTLQSQTRRILFINNDNKRLEIFSTQPISFDRLGAIIARFSYLSSSLRNKLSFTVRDSSKNTYQLLWKNLANFIFSQYGNSRFSYRAIIEFFWILIDSNYSSISIPRHHSAFHAPLKLYFPELNLLEDEIVLISYWRKHYF